MEVEIKPNSAIVIPRVKFSGPKGSREVDLILDTGAMYTAISWDVAKDIGYNPAKTHQQTTIVTANGVVEVPLIKVASVSLQNLKITYVPVICHDIPEMVEVEGLLGLSFLQNFKTTLDYHFNIVRIEKVNYHRLRRWLLPLPLFP